MSRENTRQIARLRALKNYIQNNPKEFNQLHPELCLVGLGVRLYKGVMRPGTTVANLGWGELKRRFSERYGISIETANRLFYGNYVAINANFKKNYKNGIFFTAIPVLSVVRMLEYLATQKEKGNTP